MRAIQRSLSILYPDQCVLCRELVDRPGALCPSCWRDMAFITGHACGLCGAPLIGESDGHSDHCDDCLSTARPWSGGRAALLYGGSGRRFILALKHGDRPELAKPAAEWLSRALEGKIEARTVVVPVPIHWSRMIRRRYNQSAEITRALGNRLGIETCPDALVRRRRTDVQDGLDPDARFRNQAESIAVRRGRECAIAGRPVLLVDDVMTSGATLAEATRACHEIGASRVFVAVVARAVRNA